MLIEIKDKHNNIIEQLRSILINEFSDFNEVSFIVSDGDEHDFKLLGYNINENSWNVELTCFGDMYDIYAIFAVLVRDVYYASSEEGKNYFRNKFNFEEDDYPNLLKIFYNYFKNLQIDYSIIQNDLNDILNIMQNGVNEIKSQIQQQSFIIDLNMLRNVILFDKYIINFFLTFLERIYRNHLIPMYSIPLVTQVDINSDLTMKIYILLDEEDNLTREYILPIPIENYRLISSLYEIIFNTTYYNNILNEKVL